MLREDPQESTRNILLISSCQLANSSEPVATSSDMSQPEDWTTRVNSCFSASLALSITAVLLSMTAKQWVREYTRPFGGASSDEDRAKQRHFRYRGVDKWKMSQLINSIPTIIHIALFIFFYGLVDLLFHFHPTVAFTAASLFSIGAAMWVILIIFSALFVDCPYGSPLSTALFATISPIIRPIWGHLLIGVFHAKTQWINLRYTDGTVFQSQHPSEDVSNIKRREHLFSETPSLLQQKSSAVRNDHSLYLQTLEWLFKSPDFQITADSVFHIIRMAIPSIDLEELSAWEFERDAQRLPFLATLCSRFREGPKVGEFVSYNLVACAIARLLGRYGVRPAFFASNIETFSNLVGKEPIRPENMDERLSFDMWTAILSLRLATQTTTFDGLIWYLFRMDFFRVPLESAVIAFEAMATISGPLPEDRRETMAESLVQILAPLATPADGNRSLEIEVAAMDEANGIPYRLLRPIIQLISVLINLRPSYDLVTGLEEGSVLLRERERPGEAGSARRRHQFQHSLAPLNRSLLHSVATESHISELLHCVRIVLRLSPPDPRLASYSTTTLFWVWNRQSSLLRTESVAIRLLHTLLVLFWELEWVEDAERPELHPPNPRTADLGLLDYDEETWTLPEDGILTLLFEQCKTIIVAADRWWAWQWKDHRKEYCEAYLCSKPVSGESGDSGLFHSWPFSVFDHLSETEKRECIGAAAELKIRAALAERWGLALQAPPISGAENIGKDPSGTATEVAQGGPIHSVDALRCDDSKGPISVVHFVDADTTGGEAINTLEVVPTELVDEPQPLDAITPTVPPIGEPAHADAQTLPRDDIDDPETLEKDIRNEEGHRLDSLERESSS